MAGYLFVALFVSTFILAAILTLLMRKIAPALGFLDHPGERKVHHKAKPVLGGAAILLSQMTVLFTGWMVLQQLDSLAIVEVDWLSQLIVFLSQHAAGARAVRGEILGLVLGGLVVFFVGLYDDRYGMTPTVKLGGQILAGLILYAAHIRITFFFPFPSPLWSLCLTVFWVVLVTNSYNLLDNMDGLSGGVATISVLILAWATFSLGGQLFVTAYLVALAGAIVGFLVYNFYPSTIFMGDAGSMFVGFNLAAMSILATFISTSGQGWSDWAIIMPVIIMAVPMFDTISVIIIRIKNRKPIFVGDKNHFSHRLVALGMSQRNAVLTIYLVTSCTGLGALLLCHIDNTTGAFLILLQTIVVFCIIALLEHVKSNGGDSREGG